MYVTCRVHLPTWVISHPGVGCRRDVSAWRDCITLRRQFRIVGPEEEGVAQVVMVGLQQITALSAVRVFIHKDLRSPESCEHGLRVRLIHSTTLSPPHHTYKPASSITMSGVQPDTYLWCGIRDVVVFLCLQK